MKKNLLLILFSVAVFVISTAETIELLSSGGKAGYTGSPTENTCTQCHSGTTGIGSVYINVNVSGGTYVPGQTYQVSVTVSHTGLGLFGLGVEALLNSNNTNAGTFVITNSTETQIKVANSRNNVVHKSNGGLASNSKTFNFNWTAPATDLGTITFYVSGIACDNDGGNSGDYTYNATLAILSPTSSVNENVSTGEGINVYYSNTNRNIHLSLKNKNKSNVTGNIYNIKGQKVVELFNETMLGNVEKNFSVSEQLPKGVYIIQIKQENNIISKKIFID